MGVSTVGAFESIASRRIDDTHQILWEFTSLRPQNHVRITGMIDTNTQDYQLNTHHYFNSTRNPPVMRDVKLESTPGIDQPPGDARYRGSHTG